MFNAVQEENRRLWREVHELRTRVDKIDAPLEQYFQREVEQRLMSARDTLAKECYVSSMDRLGMRLEKERHWRNLK